jgi:outer membrane receptor protein involved in Fe transport
MPHRSRFTLTVLAALLAAIGTARASGVPILKEVVITARNGALLGVADSATEGSVGAAQIATRPLLRAAELVETIPGMIVTQHSGDGKANQYFLRGFNLDHGSDFATSVLGVPVNIPTHGHGQGYMDLNFVIPELVSAVHYRKGVYAAEDGDFSSTGSARIDYQRQLERPLIDLTVGQRGYRRLLAAAGSGPLLAALELAANDGPWDQPEALCKTNALLRWSHGTPTHGHALTAQIYRSHWTATEHVPERASDKGEIGRFGALSAADGGLTHRFSVSGEWAQTSERGATRANAYALDYALNLFSAPSGFITGPDGDQHEQADQRLLWGGALQHAWPLAAGELALGAQLRHDRIANLGLYRSIARQRTATVRQDRIDETAGALFATWHNAWAPWLRTSLGLRHDRIRASAHSTGGPLNVANGGNVSASQTSPKLSIVLTPGARTELFANWGLGFHSNDVRGATSGINPANGSATDKLDLFSRAKGGELGVRIEPLPGWTSSVSLWRISLGSELVFVGDEGVTEARGASRRHGVEWSNYLTPAKGVIIDADLALSRARFLTGEHVPNAIPVTTSLGVSVDRGGNWFAGLRTRYIGAYALEESGHQKSRPILTSNLKLGYRLAHGWQVAIDLLNLFDRRANDIEYWGAACTRSEQASGACSGGIDARLVHPLEPRTVRANLRAAF